MCKGPLIKYAEQSLDYIISSLFLGLEIYQEENLNITQILGLVSLAAAILSKIGYEKKCTLFKVDLSHFFLWLMTIERIFTVSETKTQTNVLLFYIIGFNNGQYTSKIQIEEMPKGLEIGKLSIQCGIFLTLLVLQNEQDYLTIILLAMLIFAVSLNEFRQPSIPKSLSIQPSLNQSSFQIHVSPQYQSQSRSRIYQNEISFIQMDQQQIEIQPPQQSINWKKYIEQSDDYICRLTLSQQLDKTLEQAQKNYSFCKFLQDTKLNIVQFMKELRVKNELTVSLYDLSNSETGKQLSLYDWMNSNLDSNMMGVFKQIKPIQQLLLDENMAVSVQEVQKSGPAIDPFLEMSMSGISAIPLVQGSLDVSNMKNRLGLYGKLRVNGLFLRKYQQLIIKEVDNQNQKFVVLLFRDLDHQVRQIKLNQKNVEKVNTTIKFIQQQATMIQQVHIRILKQQNFLGESQRSRQTTQNRGISMSSQKDFVDDAQSEITEKSHRTFYHSFICKLQYQFLKIQQNNFNYFEVYSTNDIVQFDKKTVFISQVINVLFEQFHYDELVCQQRIKLILNDSQLISRMIYTDTRRLKQLLFNLIMNAIASYNKNEDPYQMKSVEIVLQGYEDNMRIEVIDFGCGMIEEQIRARRFQECKLGLAASQKLLNQIGSGDKQFRIKSQPGHTVVQFELPTVLEIERQEAFEEEFDFDSIQFSSS